MQVRAISMNSGLLWGIVACSFGQLGFPGGMGPKQDSPRGRSFVVLPAVLGSFLAAWLDLPNPPTLDVHICIYIYYIFCNLSPGTIGHDILLELGHQV